MNQQNTVNPKYVGHTAQRRKRRARIIICGIPKVGKTTFAILLMRGLVGEQGRFSAFDTDEDAHELYGDLTEFNVVPLYECRPQDVPDMIQTKEAEGYDGVIIDNMSDFWSGPGGELDQVELLKGSYKGNSQPAWKDVGEFRQQMLSATKHTRMHFIGTMMLKPETVTYKDPNTGKTTTERIGMKPDQKENFDRHYDVVLTINTRHEVYCEGSRYACLKDNEVVTCGPVELGRRIARWLNSAEGGEPLPRPTVVTQPVTQQQQRREPEHRRSEHPTQPQKETKQPAKAESQTQTTPADSIKLAVDAWEKAIPPAAAWLQRYWSQVLHWAQKDNSADAVEVLRQLYAGRVKGLAPDHIINSAAIKKVRNKSAWVAVVTNPASKPGDWITTLMEHAVPGEEQAIEAAVAGLTGARAASWASELCTMGAEDRASWVREVLRLGWPDDARNGGAQ